MKPTRHLFVFLEIFAAEGGIQSYVKDVLRAYRDLPTPSHATVLLLRDPSDCANPFAESDRFTFHYLKTRSPQLGRLRFVFALLSNLMRNRPERVFCGHINLAPLVKNLCQPLGIPYIVMTYGKEVWKPVAPAAQKALQQAEKIWSISRYSRDQACEANQLAPQNVAMVPCVVDGDRFQIGEKSPELLATYQLQDATVLMTVARLWSGDIYKGVDVTIRALPQVIKEFPNVKYLVIGRGDDQPRLAALTEELGIADRVVFAGFVPTPDLPAHYRLADAYVMPSQEGFGIVYLEAMVSGVPVISGDADGSADPVQDGRVGWRVPHRDPDKVAAACLELLHLRHQQNSSDRRCDPQWLREESLKQFGFEALTKCLAKVI